MYLYRYVRQYLSFPLQVHILITEMVCNKFHIFSVYTKMPRWILAFVVGMLIGWMSFALHDTLLATTVDTGDASLHRKVTSSHIQGVAGGSGHSATVNHLPPKYHAANKFDLQSWEYFDNSAIYNDENVNMVFWRHAAQHRNLEIQAALKEATSIASRHFRKNFRMHKLISGYVRHNPTRGYEYIVDAQYIETCSMCVARPVTRRVSFVRPLGSTVPVDDITVSNKVVNIIIPISNVNQRFKEFLENFETAFLKEDDNIHLLFVVYQEDIGPVEATVQHYRSKYPSSRITILKGQGTFSRGRALDYGMSSLKDGELAFFCDVDITVQRPFMNRCRKNTIQGKRVFYPVVFKLYNSRYAYNHDSKPNKAFINRQHGHWFYYSYGMLCIYKSDYRAVGGLDINIEGWGLEDVLFYEAILKAKLEVIKAPDPGLTHRWHESRCPSTLTKKQHSDCLGSLYEGVADKKELARYIYDNGYQIQEEPSSR